MSSNNGTEPLTSEPAPAPSPSPSTNSPDPAPSTAQPTTQAPPASSATPPPAPSTTPTTTPTQISVPPSVTTVTPSNEPPTTTVRSTSTAAPISPTNNLSSGTGDAVSSPSPSPSSTGGAVKSGGGSSGGLSGTAKVAVAVVVPVVAVALICVLLLLLYRRRKNKQAAEEARKKEVEDYAFNPNSGTGPGGAIIAGDQEPYDMEETSTNGYRGWGSTTGARSKISGSTGAPTSNGPISPVLQAYPTTTSGGDPMYSPQNGLVKEIGGAAVPIHGQGPQSDGGFSTAPLVAGGNSAEIFGKSQPQQQPVGVERGLSNASSNYSALTHGSQESDGVGHHGYYDGAGGYPMEDIGTAYSGHPTQHYQAYNPNMGAYGNQVGGDGGYGMAFGGMDTGNSPPVIRDVSARRNTKIETPTSEHFPQQGSGGIAQNF